MRQGMRDAGFWFLDSGCRAGGRRSVGAGEWLATRGFRQSGTLQRQERGLAGSSDEEAALSQQSTTPTLHHSATGGAERCCEARSPRSTRQPVRPPITFRWDGRPTKTLSPPRRRGPDEGGKFQGLELLHPESSKAWNYSRGTCRDSGGGHIRKSLRSSACSSSEPTKRMRVPWSTLIIRVSFHGGGRSKQCHRSSGSILDRRHLPLEGSAPSEPASGEPMSGADKPASCLRHYAVPRRRPPARPPESSIEKPASRIAEP